MAASSGLARGLWACINPGGKRKWAGLEEIFLMREKKGYYEMEIHNVRGDSGNL